MRKREIMTTNRYCAELVKMRQQIEEAMAEKHYAEWVRKTNEAIAEINRRIRSTNKETA